MNMKTLLGILALAAVTAGSAAAAPAESIRLGVISTTTGPLAVLGKEQYMGADLALKMLGNKIGGIPVEVFKEDAGMTPDTALRATTRLTEKDNIDFLVGQQLSNQLLAYVKPVTATGTIIISGIAGPSELAGKDCNPNLFAVSWQNNMPSEAVGQLMTNSHVKRAYFMSQNYVTGKEYVTGAKAYYKGEVAGEAYVPIPQVDYAAELATIRAANPDAIYVFLPGAGGVAFVKQFASSGMKDKVALFGGSWLADEHSFPALGDVAIGINVAAPWFSELKNPENEKYVAEFRQEYGRNPVFYSAFVYDSIMLLDGAVKAVHGDISDKKALRAAIQSAPFKSTRGKFAFNVNHFPIENFYSARVAKKNGVLQHEVLGTIFEDHKDSFSESCKMAP
ncbi:MAG: ABC transporter substrate-binding protein [Xanthobacteraceae bacterium]|jgi:branched-chain amino acid transport system substrate-binding protein